MTDAQAPARTTRRGAARRTIAVADLHGDLTAFRQILTAAGVLEGESSWRGGATILVQLGDVIDRGPDSVATYRFLGELQVRARKGKGKVVRLLGNHEVALLEGDYGLADFPEPEKLAERIRQDVTEGRVQAAFAHGGWLFTHAGAGYALVQRLRSEMRGNPGEGATPRRFSLNRLATHLNGKLRRAVEQQDFSDPIFSVGAARGGERATGGIFWADYDEELQTPARAPRFHQVFGHTPEGYEGARFRVADDGRRINIDIGINDEYGGNLGYLEVRGREAVAHYLTEEGEEVVPLGEAPVSRRRKRPPEPVDAPPTESKPE